MDKHFFKKFSSLVTISENNNINDDELLWKLPNCVERFNEITFGKIIIMDKESYLSINKPFSNRINIVICGDDINYIHQHESILTSNTGLIKLSTEEETIEFIYNFEKSKSDGHEVSNRFNTNEFIIIGKKTHEYFLPYINKLYITKVDTNINGFEFPDISNYDWKLLKNTKYKKDDQHNYDYSFLNIEKI